ncbi:MAG TPA: zinc-ribbon domain-containing protein, partial [Terriglobales bacterium]|nr:zinc-ribbon domain-containing protein [Terriglobales bacterium]
MTFCTKCGAQVPEMARFCQVCGQPQAAAGTAPATPTPVPQAQSGLSENTAALLSYVLGWLTGIIFYLIDHRPYVRYHAAQSIVTFGGLHIMRAIVAVVFGVGWWW